MGGSALWQLYHVSTHQRRENYTQSSQCVIVHKNMAIGPATAAGMQPQHYNQEAEDLRREILKNVPYAEQWLSSPNTRLRGQTPEQAIAAGQLEAVRNVVDSILSVCGSLLNLTNCSRLTRRNLTGTWYREVPSQHLSRAILTDHTTKKPTRFAAGSPTKPAHEVLYLSENDIQLPFETRRTFGYLTQPATIVSVPARDAYTRITANVYLTDIADLTDPQQADLIFTNAQELTGDWEVYPDRTPRSAARLRRTLALPLRSSSARKCSTIGLSALSRFLQPSRISKIWLCFPSIFQDLFALLPIRGPMNTVRCNSSKSPELMPLLVF